MSNLSKPDYITGLPFALSNLFLSSNPRKKFSFSSISSMPLDLSGFPKSRGILYCAVRQITDSIKPVVNFRIPPSGAGGGGLQGRNNMIWHNQTIPPDNTQKHRSLLTTLLTWGVRQKSWPDGQINWQYAILRLAWFTEPLQFACLLGCSWQALFMY